MRKKIIILGTGGTCFDIADTVLACENFELVGFLDDNAEIGSLTKMGYPVLGKLEDAHKFRDELFVNGIGSPHSFKSKKNIIAKTGLNDSKFATIIHPSVQLAKNCQIANGTVILANCSVGSFAQIGNHVVILQNCVIGHDSQIGNYSTVSAGVTISGRVTIGESCYIGAGSSLKENSSVNHDSLLGIGSILLKNVPPNEVWYGVPAKKAKE